MAKIGLGLQWHHQPVVVEEKVPYEEVQVRQVDLHHPRQHFHKS